MKTKSLLVRLLIALACVGSLQNGAWAQSAVPGAVVDGYHGTAWGTPLSEFTAAKKSRSDFIMDPLVEKGLDYLLMNFHEVAQDDPAYPAGINFEKIHGDSVEYVFYGNKYSLAAVPIDPANLNAVEKELGTKYTPKDRKWYPAYWKFIGGEYGWKMMGYKFSAFEKSPGTLVYLVTASSFYDDGALVDGGSMNITFSPESGAFLVYASADYFQNAKNAWSDYRANKRVQPGEQKEAQANRLKQDLSRIE
jgi:hypothetical protein